MIVLITLVWDSAERFEGAGKMEIEARASLEISTGSTIFS